MPCIEVSVTVMAPPDAIYPILKDMEKYPEFMTDLVSVKVLDRQGGETITHWVSNIDGFTIQWTERDVFDDEKMHIAYCQTKGDLKKFQGEWILTPLIRGTEIKLTVDFEFGVPMIAGLLNPILKNKVRSNSENMLKAIQTRLEENDVSSCR